MTVQDLINELEKVKDKELEVRILNMGSHDEENIWATEIEVSDKGESGYEFNGEVRIIGYE